MRCEIIPVFIGNGHVLTHWRSWKIEGNFFGFIPHLSADDSVCVDKSSDNPLRLTSNWTSYRLFTRELYKRGRMRVAAGRLSLSFNRLTKHSHKQRCPILILCCENIFSPFFLCNQPRTYSCFLFLLVTKQVIHENCMRWWNSSGIFGQRMDALLSVPPAASIC